MNICTFSVFVAQIRAQPSWPSPIITKIIIVLLMYLVLIVNIDIHLHYLVDGISYKAFIFQSSFFLERAPFLSTSWGSGC